MAKTMAMVFKDSFTKEEYSKLREYLRNERVLLSQKWVLQRNVEMPLLMNINEELKLAYEDFRDNSAIPNSMPLFFEYTSFIFENERDNTILRRLRIGNVVSINIENRGNFAIIRAIFCHQKDNLRFVFVVVDWFEETNRTILGCPVYRLQTTNANLRRRRRMYRWRSQF
ncbi:17414_t:CDS:2 [Rhizophagus irregularis]|nr:17414_t:CDS:2 [Rhizophagus irregularis]